MTYLKYGAHIGYLDLPLFLVFLFWFYFVYYEQFF
jgi:hypothetical protein